MHSASLLSKFCDDVVSELIDVYKTNSGLQFASSDAVVWVTGPKVIWPVKSSASKSLMRWLM